MIINKNNKQISQNVTKIYTNNNYNGKNNYCKLCNKFVKVIKTGETILSENHRQYNNKIHFLLCKSCRNTSNITSFTICKKKYQLKKQQLNNLKILYISNIRNNNKYYIWNDINNIIISIYGSLDKFQLVRETDLGKKMVRERQTQLNKIHRELELRRIFKDNKLDFSCNYGDCYTYVQYGWPSIDSILDNKIDEYNSESINSSSSTASTISSPNTMSEQENDFYTVSID